MTNMLFNRYRNLAAKAEVTLGTKESLKWFSQRIRKESRIRNLDNVTQGLKVERPGPGKLMTYLYDPKYKEKLKYYDSHPLIICLEVAPKGWYGANIHYLPPTLRARLFEELDYNANSLNRIATMLSKNSYTAPCLKRYLAKHVMSQPVVIPKEEWEIAIQLPFENFQKQTMKSIWQESRNKI